MQFDSGCNLWLDSHKYSHLRTSWLKNVALEIYMLKIIKQTQKQNQLQPKTRGGANISGLNFKDRAMHRRIHC